jgi:hypothetical protein
MASSIRVVNFFTLVDYSSHQFFYYERDMVKALSLDGRGLGRGLGRGCTRSQDLPGNESINKIMN